MLIDILVIQVKHSAGYGILETMVLKISFMEEEGFTETPAINEHKLVLYNIVLLDLN